MSWSGFLWQAAMGAGCWHVGPAWPASVSPGWDAVSLESRIEEHRTWIRSLGTGFRPVPNPLRGDSWLLRAAEAQNRDLVFAYGLARAMTAGQNLRVLDWGGAFGSYALLARRLFPDARFDWHVCELQSVCRLGSKETPDVTFIDGEDSWSSKRFDFVFSSSAVQYVRDWRGQVRSLLAVAEEWCLITRIPVVGRTASYVFRQERGWRNGGYPGWALNRGELTGVVSESGFSVVAEMLVSRWMRVFGAPEQPVTMGFLLRRTSENNG